jgi:hypothetical protein
MQGELPTVQVAPYGASPSLGFVTITVWVEPPVNVSVRLCAVGVAVGVTVGVLVGVLVGVFVGVGVRVGVAVGVAVGVFVGVAVGVFVAVGVGVRVAVAVGVCVAVGVAAYRRNGVLPESPTSATSGVASGVGTGVPFGSSATTSMPMRHGPQTGTHCTAPRTRHAGVVPKSLVTPLSDCHTRRQPVPCVHWT